MSWISLILQLLTLRRGLNESRSMVEAARGYAERGKRALAATLVAALAALFFFSALLLAVIELGLQIDQGGGLHYSGLMISSTILAGFGLLGLLAAYLIGRDQAPTRPAEPEPGQRSERVKDLLEEFLSSFLQQLLKPKDGAKASSPAEDRDRS